MEPAQLFYVDGSPFSRLCQTLVIDWELPVEVIKLEWPLDEAFFDKNPLDKLPDILKQNLDRNLYVCNEVVKMDIIN